MSDFRLEFPQIHHSLETIAGTPQVREIYPEDCFPGGAYVTLPYGRVRHWIFGPEDGIKVVLIHGFTIPAVTFRDVAPVLAANGLRVLLYDLYGKGYSEAPVVQYDANFFITQLALLLQYLKWDKANIVGFSMGGGITSAFAAVFPYLCDKLVFIASAGIPERVTPTGIEANRPPTNAHPSPIPSMGNLRGLQEACLPGYKESIQSILRYGPLANLKPAFQYIGKYDPPFKVLIIHGTDDAIVNIERGHSVKEAIPHAEFVSVEGAGHDLLVTKPYADVVNDALVRFLK